MMVCARARLYCPLRSLNRIGDVAKFLRASGLAALLTVSVSIPALADAPSAKAVAKTYADIALAGYEDAFTTAKTMRETINALVNSPSAETLQSARDAWLSARVPYQQREAYRFGNAIVDEWEGKVNAWPLDEGLIDDADGAYDQEAEENDLYIAHVIARKSLKINGETVDTTTITKTLLADTLQEAGEIEANVATGYHANEFLLWGQDLNGTGPGAGKRPATDFDPSNCTRGKCDQRVA